MIVTIPKKIAEFKGISKGTKIAFKEHTKNTLIIEIIPEEKKNTKKR